MYSLHNHSDYSNAALGFADSINTLENLIKSAKELGLSGLAISDHENISASYKAQQLSKKYDFPVILGNEIYLQTPEQYQEAKFNYKSKVTYYPHFILLAVDTIGHEQLRQLSSIAWRDNSYFSGGLLRRPTKITDIEQVINDNKGHIIAQTACIGSFLGHSILELLKIEKTNNEDLIYEQKLKIDEYINWGIKTFGKDNFIIEIQPAKDQNEQYYYNQRAIQIAKAYDLDYVVTTDSHYIGKDKAKVHASFLNSKDAEREVDSFYATAYLMSEGEVRDYLNKNISQEDIDIAINNTIKIGERIQPYDLSHAQIIPLIDAPQFELQHSLKKYYEEFEYIKLFAYSNREQDRYLLWQIENVIFDKTTEADFGIVLDRINKELCELWKISEAQDQPIGGYYNTFAKIIELVWTKGDSLVGPNRGSTGAFYIAYLLGITQINPLPLGDLMPYWRHISAERGLDLPDIDFDTEASKRKQILQAMKDYFGENKVLNVCTFGTLSSKTAIQVAGRGLDLMMEEVESISDLIPIERGAVYSLSDCRFGNLEKNRAPVKEFINVIKEYPELLQVASDIEGLIVQRGIHASGIIILNEDYTKHNACMRSPNGDLITQFDLHDSESMSAIKYDFLTISSLDIIRKNMDMLIEDGHMQWQGTLKSTYDKYLHPEVIDYEDKVMWSNIANIPSLFQFDSMVGAEAIKRVKPSSALEMSVANSLMRLMGDGLESPLDQFVRYKSNINLWYDDMKNYGLNDEEIELLKQYLLNSYGLADSQEKVMLLSMCPKISNFTLKEANTLRKSIAKKRFDILQEAKKIFYNKGKEAQTREIFLQYVWEEVFAKSFGYSFSSIHSYGYTIIAVQEMNLYTKYPHIYWECSCLIINSGSDENNDSNKSTNYGKVASAIGFLQSQGVKIDLPDINRSKFGFSVDTVNDSILFGLKGMVNIGDDIAINIINKRPYISLIDFIKKTETKKTSVINLIKGGAFDQLEHKDRVQIMKDYLSYLAQREYEPKSKLTLSYLDKINELGLLSNDNDIYLRYYNFNKYVINKEFFKEKIKNKSYYIAKEKAFNFFEQHYISKLKENVDYWYTEEGIVFCKSSYDKIYKQQMEWITNYINLSDVINSFNQKNCDNYIEENWNKYCLGNISSWEMDSLGYYYHEHELSNINKMKYNITDFDEIPEQPVVESTYTKKGKEFPKYRLYKIIGTVLDRDKTKHIVTLLTTDGVVSVKFYSGAFINYDRQSSVTNGDKKEILERSWFKRGTKLMISGIRRDDRFFPKKYCDSIYNHTVCLIEGIQGEDLVLKLERE
jgi:DNA polymerase-3 subunit alpha